MILWDLSVADARRRILLPLLPDQGDLRLARPRETSPPLRQHALLFQHHQQTRSLCYSDKPSSSPLSWLHGLYVTWKPITSLSEDLSLHTLSLEGYSTRTMMASGTGQFVRGAARRVKDALYRRSAGQKLPPMPHEFEHLALTDHEQRRGSTTPESFAGELQGRNKVVGVMKA